MPTATFQNGYVLRGTLGMALGAALLLGCAGTAATTEPTSTDGKAPAGDSCKDPKDCLNQGARALIAKDYAKAVKFLPTACEVEPKACFNAAEIYRKGDGGVPVDMPKAADFYKKSCDGKLTVACAIESQMRYSGEGGVTVDKARARTLFEMTCGPEYLDHCTNAGIMYSAGDGGPADKTKARALFDQACASNELTACVNGGAMYLNGEGGPADKAKARGQFEKACDANNANGCINLGLVYGKGIDVPIDLEKSISLLEKACKAGAPKGCEIATQIKTDLEKQKAEQAAKKGKKK